MPAKSKKHTIRMDLHNLSRDQAKFVGGVLKLFSDPAFTTAMRDVMDGSHALVWDVGCAELSVVQVLDRQESLTKEEIKCSLN